jgi:hypothetical protein
MADPFRDLAAIVSLLYNTAKLLESQQLHHFCTGCGCSRAEAIKLIADGAIACCPDCSTLTVADRNAIRAICRRPD